MTDLAGFARALQVGDSAFPTGAFGFSWGLEELARAGVVNRDRVAPFARAQILGRWARLDRPLTAAAHAAAGDAVRLAALDRLAEALSWSPAAREGSRRAGAGALAAHRNLGEAGLDAYARAVEDGDALGHLSVVEGLVHAAAGLDRPHALAMSGMGAVARLMSAAVRLNLVGAISAQRITAALAVDVAALAAEPPPRPGAFAPLADIAMMRHERGRGALFAN